MKPENNEKNYTNCICPACPSYNDCCEKTSEKAFCANKRCSCEVERKSCICGNCPVYKENDVSGGYFCINERGY